jgi:hypothetical protein
MCKTQNEQKTKPKLNDYAKRLAGTVYLKAVLSEQNYIIPLLTIKNFATPLSASNFTTCSGIPLCIATLFTSRH